MVENYIEFIKKCLVFTGRAERNGFLLFVYAHIIIGFVIGIIMELMGMYKETGVVCGFYGLAVLLIISSAGVRRLHDIGRSGWWYLIVLIPLVNMVLVTWLCLDSDLNTNKYGDCPIKK
jgi:uncharacterized membrane protein YhaH (DUF805 family)